MFVFRNWTGGVYTKSSKVCFDIMLFLLMYEMEYVFLKGFFTYAVKITTLTKKEHD